MKNYKYLIFTLMLIGFTFNLFAANQPSSKFPKQIMIVRHGEKPSDSINTTPFVTNVLALKGSQRAAALAPFFLGTPELNKFGPPANVYAVHPTSHHESLRPLQTCMPTADALDLTVNLNYTLDDDPQTIAKDILNDPKNAGKNILLCWEHKHIAGLAHAFGVTPEPEKWPDSVFDWVYVLQLDDNGKVSSFQILPQQLMYEDSGKVTFKK